MTTLARETARLTAVRRYTILDTPPEGAFDRITRLAARLFDVPIAIVSVVDHDRIWFKSHHGLDVSEVQRAPGLCASAVLQEGPWVIENATVDPRTLANPLVVGSFGLQFYAGVPLRTHDGHNLGTLCLLDFLPRTLTATELETLEDLAAIVMSELELRLASVRELREIGDRFALENRQLQLMSVTDPLTGIANRRALTEGLSLAVADSAYTGLPVSVVLLDLDHFKRVNDDYGHLAGDRVLEATAALLRRHLRPGDFAARFGGEEFVLVLRQLPLHNAGDVADRIRVALSTMPLPGLDLSITASFGVVAHDGHETAEALLARADAALYRAKRAGRNQVVADLAPVCARYAG